MLAFHYREGCKTRVTDAMVRNAALRIVIGPDLIGTVAASYHGFTLRTNRIIVFFQLDLVVASERRTPNARSLFFNCERSS